MEALTGRERLADCPVEPHLAWLFSTWLPGAAAAASDDIADHIAPNEAPFEQHVAWSVARAAGPEAVAEVLGWRVSRFGGLVATYRAVNERLYDILVHAEPQSGRLVMQRPMRSSQGVDIGPKLTRDLTDDEWSAVTDVFADGFDHADADFLRRRIGELGAISLGWRDGRLLGFSAVGLRQAELPYIGHRSFMDTGLLCVRPDAQKLGLSDALGAIAMQAAPRTGPNEFAVLHFATPITLKASFRFGRSTWPGVTIQEVAAAMRNPSRCQREVGAALAELAGAVSYDADHWVMRNPRPLGVSTARPQDLEPEYAALFAHVDPAEGDALLGVQWWSEPPEVWWR